MFSAAVYTNQFNFQKRRYIRTQIRVSSDVFRVSICPNAEWPPVPRPHTKKPNQMLPSLGKLHRSRKTITHFPRPDGATDTSGFAVLQQFVACQYSSTGYLPHFSYHDGSSSQQYRRASMSRGSDGMRPKAPKLLRTAHCRQHLQRKIREL